MSWGTAARITKPLPGALLDRSHPLGQVRALYLLDGMQRVFDVATPAATGQRTGGVIPSGGRAGSAANFNGTTGYYPLGVLPALNLPGAYAIGVVCRLATVAIGARQLCGDANSAASLIQYTCEVNRTAAKMSAIHATTVVHTGTVSLVAQQWYALLWQRTGVAGAWTVETWINGALDARTTGITTNPSVQQGASLGRPGAFNGGYFSGDIEAVWVWDRYWLAPQVAQWAAEPYGMLAPRARQWVVPAAAGRLLRHPGMAAMPPDMTGGIHA